MKLDITKILTRTPEVPTFTKGWGQDGYPKLDFTEVMKEFKAKQKEGK